MLSILVGSKCHYIVSRVCLFFFCNYFSFPLIKPLKVLNLSLWHEEISQVSSTLPASIFRTQACFLPGSTEVAQRFLLSWVWVGVVEGCGEGWGLVLVFLLHSRLSSLRILLVDGKVSFFGLCLRVLVHL